MSDEINPVYAGPAAAAPAVAPIPTPAAAPTVSDIVALTDARGRVLTLRKELTFLQEMDLLALAGAQRSANEAWLNFLMMAVRVATIDGAPVPFPTSEAGLRALLQRVDRSGVVAVIDHFSPPAEEGGDGGDRAAADPEADAKN
jgi:hypothetical protein